jgi:hypothetical protein
MRHPSVPDKVRATRRPGSGPFTDRNRAMNRLLWLGALALPLVVLTPQRSSAIGISPDCAHGYPWFQAKCLNKFAWIHMHGPLYNYGPSYCGPGYFYRQFPEIAYHHGYYPAYPAAVWGYGAYGYGAYGYGGYGGAAPQQQPCVGPNCPAQNAPQATPEPIGPPAAGMNYNPYQALYPNNPYQTLNPNYYGPAWPGVQR